MARADTRKFASVQQEAVNIVNDVTPSVIALGRASGLSAEDFATALGEADSNSLYRTEVSQALQGILINRAVEEAEEDGAEG